jgi:FkbM family methyltransferase
MRARPAAGCALSHERTEPAMRGTSLARRALDTFPALRTITDAPLARQVIQTGRAARALRPAGRFVVNQRRRASVDKYRLRGNQAAVYLRRRTRDVDILAEIFTEGSYEPPTQVEPLLRGPLRILDLGANVGLFGLYALQRWMGSALESFEPDPENYALLERTAAPHRRWRIHESAVSNDAEPIRFATGQYADGRAAVEEDDAITVPCADLFTFTSSQRFDLVKMDIEGGEWPILTDPRLAQLPARVLVMEWHEHRCPHPSPRAYACDLLAAAGLVHQWHEPGRFASNGLLWAWR